MQALFSRLLGLALLQRQVRTGREMYLCTHLESGGNQGTAPRSYHPIDPSPVLGRVSYRAFLAFSPCRFLPIAHVPSASALPSKFSPVINPPFPSSCLLLTTFPPFRFLFLFVTFTFAKYPTHFNKPQPIRLWSPSPLPSSSLLSSISPYARFVTTTRRSLESHYQPCRPTSSSFTHSTFASRLSSLACNTSPLADRRTNDEGSRSKSTETPLSRTRPTYTRISLPPNTYAPSSEARADRTLVTNTRNC